MVSVQKKGTQTERGLGLGGAPSSSAGKPQLFVNAPGLLYGGFS